MDCICWADWLGSMRFHSFSHSLTLHHSRNILFKTVLDRSIKCTTVYRILQLIA